MFIFLIGSGVYTLEVHGELPFTEQELSGSPEGPPEALRRKASIYLAVDVPSVVQVDPLHFSSRYGKIKNYMPTVLSKWFERKEELRIVTRAYSEALINDGSYEEAIFLRITQVLEYFHGIIMPVDTKYFSKASWKKFISWLREQFPEFLRDDPKVTPETFPNLKELIVQRISPLNKISFRSRLDQLFRGVSERELMPIMKNPYRLSEEIERFLRSVEATRNYLTHHSEEQASEALFGGDLQEAVFRCWAVLTYWIAKCLGLDDETSGDIAFAAKRGQFLVSKRTGL